jgi:hypothetical protein
MTFSTFWGTWAPDTVDVPAVAPGVAAVNAPAIDLVELFKLDRLPAEHRLVCHWHRERDGRLACSWEPDIVPDPQR